MGITLADANTRSGRGQAAHAAAAITGAAGDNGALVLARFHRLSANEVQAGIRSCIAVGHVLQATPKGRLEHALKVSWTIFRRAQHTLGHDASR